MKINRIDHINIAAPADLLEKVKNFYCEILGFDDGGRPSFSGPGYWLYAGGHPLIHLSEKEGETAPPGNGFFDHVAFSGEGLGRFKRRLDEAGIDYQQKLVPGRELSQLFFRDPAGIRLEINFEGER